MGLKFEGKFTLVILAIHIAVHNISSSLSKLKAIEESYIKRINPASYAYESNIHENTKMGLMPNRCVVCAHK